MIKGWALAALFFAAAANVPGIENLEFKIFKNPYGVLMGLSGGLENGKLDEIVYYEDGGKESELVWMVYPLIVAGGTIRLEPVDVFQKMGFSVYGSFVFGFPGKAGYVRDSDYDANGAKAVFSEHEGEYKNFLEGEGEFGFLIPITQSWVIEALAGVFFRQTETEAYDGYIQGGEGGGFSEDMVAFNLYGTAVQYRQSWIIFAPGVGGRYRFGKNTARLSFFITPLQWGDHVDRHFFRLYDETNENMKYIEFEDKVREGLYFRIQGEWMYQLTERLEGGITARYGKSFNSRGDTRISSTGYERKREIGVNLAGAGFDGLSINFGIRVGL
jgi:outer membrane protease